MEHNIEHELSTCHRSMFLPTATHRMVICLNIAPLEVIYWVFCTKRPARHLTATTHETETFKYIKHIAYKHKRLMEQLKIPAAHKFTYMTVLFSLTVLVKLWAVHTFKVWVILTLSLLQWRSNLMLPLDLSYFYFILVFNSNLWLNSPLL